MKLLFSVLFLLVSNVALAYPSLNDYASYLVVISPEGFNRSFSMLMSLEVKSFNETNKTFQVVKTVDYPNGESDDQSFDLKASDMISSAAVKGLLANCASYGGVREKVSVVAGTFDSCKVKMDESMVWWADVPFGKVKWEYDGEIETSADTQATKQSTLKANDDGSKPTNGSGTKKVKAHFVFELSLVGDSGNF